MAQLYFQNSYVSIYYNKELCLGKAVWRGELVSAEFREAVLLCLDLIDRNGIKGWLGDNRKMLSISASDLEWCTKVFIPQLIESPLLRLANLASANEQNRKAVEVMYSKGNNPLEKFTVRDFHDEAAAVAWLTELSNQPSSKESPFKDS